MVVAPLLLRRGMVDIFRINPGVYGVAVNDVRVATVHFIKKYRPAPHMPVGYQMTVMPKKGKSVHYVVRSITEGKQKLAERW